MFCFGQKRRVCVSYPKRKIFRKFGVNTAQVTTMAQSALPPRYFIKILISFVVLSDFSDYFYSKFGCCEVFANHDGVGVLCWRQSTESCSGEIFVVWLMVTLSCFPAFDRKYFGVERNVMAAVGRGVPFDWFHTHKETPWLQRFRSIFSR